MYSIIRNCKFIIVSTVLVLFGLCTSTYTAGKTGAIVIKEGDEWHYFKGKYEPPDKWYYRDFDDSDWLKGPSGLDMALVTTIHYLMT